MLQSVGPRQLDHRRGSSNSGNGALPTIMHANGFAKSAGRGRRRRFVRQSVLLTIVLLAALLFFALQWWQLHLTQARLQHSLGGGGAAGGAGSRRLLPQKHPFPNLRNLVMVACHAVYVGFDYTKPQEPSNWFLLDYQQYPKYSESFIRHIQIGISEAGDDPSALLLFSGGQTRKSAGPRSEGEGYWMVAEAAGWYGRPGVRERAFTEEHARDSFENLLFSLCRFHELTGRAPEMVTVVGYDFKRGRYTDLHRQALRYPMDRFQYVGTPALTPGAAEGEAAAASAFRSDPYGCTGELLAKKESRDPFAVGPYAERRCPPLEPLLNYCGREVYSGPLPWDGVEFSS